MKICLYVKVKVMQINNVFNKNKMKRKVNKNNQYRNIAYNKI